jgi:hypothetical protein
MSGMTRPSSPNGSPPSKNSGGIHRGSRKGKSSRNSLRAPDMAEVARRAVVSYLHDASVATAERVSAENTGAPGDAIAETARRAQGILTAEDPSSPSAASAERLTAAESTAERAAAAGVATLERIEAAAAKVEEDIAVALQRQAELQAGAGEAAETAIRAAQESWRAARSAAESDKQARISLRLIARYVTITMALLFVAIIVLLVTATAVH